MILKCKICHGKKKRVGIIVNDLTFYSVKCHLGEYRWTDKRCRFQVAVLDDIMDKLIWRIYKKFTCRVKYIKLKTFCYPVKSIA